MTLLSRLRRFARKAGTVSYSQCGEDLIVDFLLQHILHVAKPTYLDMGAHDPVKFNNTFMSYRRGSQGVLVEPNPAYCAKLRKVRSRDAVFEIGLGEKDEHATYFRFKPDTLNTFSEEEAESYLSHGHELIQKDSVELRAVPKFLAENCKLCPDFVSMDVEGKETQILNAWNFDTYRPVVFCIETVEYTPDGSGKKRLHVVDQMAEYGYGVYADTYVNTIFADRQRWKGAGIRD